MSDAATLKSTTGKWWVQVRGRAFGPYTIDQMAQFLAEGRVRPNTNIALAKEGPWKEARAFSVTRQ